MISTMQTEQIRAVEVGRRPLISWGAVFAGWLIGNGIMLLLMNLGAALGFSAVDFSNPEGAVQGVAAGSVIWALSTWAVSFFASGVFAAWLAGHVDKAVGAAHGLCVWAMAAIAALLIGLTGVAGTLTAGAVATSHATISQNEIVSDAQTDLDAFRNQIMGTAPQTTVTTEQAAKYSAAALWFVFLSGLIGLVASVIGGSAGSRRLVTSYRRFEHV